MKGKKNIERDNSIAAAIVVIGLLLSTACFGTGLLTAIKQGNLDVRSVIEIVVGLILVIGTSFFSAIYSFVTAENKPS